LVVKTIEIVNERQLERKYSATVKLERRDGRKYTLIRIRSTRQDIEDIASLMKKRLGCGGFIEKCCKINVSHIFLQGDHLDRIPRIFPGLELLVKA